MDNDDKKLWEIYIKAVKPLKKPNLLTSKAATSSSSKTDCDIKKATSFIKTPAPFSYSPHDDITQKINHFARNFQEHKLKKDPSSDHIALHTLDQKSLRRIEKNIVKIDGRLDLHGLNQMQAYEKLVDFIKLSYQKRKRCLLIITGKGTLLKKSILQQNLPSWLNTPQFQQKITSLTPALTKHGGKGAFYVYLRKQK